MIWLTWRQLRGGAVTTAVALVALAAVLALTGPTLASDYSSGITACTRGGDCARFFDRFFDDKQIPFLAVTVVVLVLPALIGLFWGAPLIARELEAGTHLLVWNQSITRTRWLAVKLAFTGLASMTAAGLCSAAVTWWAEPLDKSAAPGFTLMDPLVFGARGIVPMAYAAFAFVLGVTVGMLVRRTLPAMAVALAVFAAVQLAMPLVVRPHLLPPVSSAFELSPANVDGIHMPRDGGSLALTLESAIPGHTGAWVLSSHLVDRSGRTLDDSGPGAIAVSTSSGPCAPPEQRPETAQAGDHYAGCLAEINRLGYRQQATYQPFDRFWPFQWIEAGLYALLIAGLTAFCFWWIRRRVS
ncbi:transporter [Microbispora corallina]|uniref:Transporter n=1 Tax=Microbispora corallina TaxID=83302 RepID=A0ABQ4G2U5_9ACTN|nr:ABC transporter permease [Microbispora corallina]GIH41392.1 transporter [Microbispora corallina]